MGQLIYSGSYPDMLTFSASAAKATLAKKNTDTVPADGVVLGVFHEVYAGISADIRGKSVTVSFTLTDAAGQSVTIVDTVTAPTTSPAYIKIGGKPGAGAIDYNNLVRVKVGGTSDLVTRKGHDCPVTVNWRKPFEPYSNETITAGTTPVRASHMLELWWNINIIRQGYGLYPHTYPEFRAGYTSLAGWTDHILEMRAAIDEIGASHEEWLPITENKPRADVIMQLRRVVAAL